MFHEVMCSPQLQGDFRDHPQSAQAHFRQIEQLRVLLAGQGQRSLPRRDQLHGHHKLVHWGDCCTAAVRADLQQSWTGQTVSLKASCILFHLVLSS